MWGDWLGSLGLEPSPELYLEHLVECFSHVWRVLRDDGTSWVNIGDSYAGSGKGPTGHNGIGDQVARQGFDKSDSNRGSQKYALVNGGRPGPGYKPKDLMLMPFRVAMALQAAGWYVRSCIPWLKRNSMPESVTDRPSSSVEYVFLLAKQPRYYFDADAVRMAGSGWMPRKEPTRGLSLSRLARGSNGRTPDRDGGYGEGITRNRRNSDWFFESWQGLLLDEQDSPLALVVNPAPFTGAHFATFPPKLAEPMVKASTSERGQCPECGAPWVRETQKLGARGVSWHDHVDDVDDAVRGQRGKPVPDGYSVTTTGWQSSCAHIAEPVPQTILDPFGGAGTVGLVADRFGRNAILCELKADYAGMGADRITSDAPLFAEVNT